MIQTLLNAIFGVIGWLVGKITDLAAEMWEMAMTGVSLLWDWFTWILGVIVEELWEALQDHLPPEWVDTINSLPMTAARNAWEDISWILPIEEVLAVVWMTYTVCGTIRLVRWCLAVTPTIGG